MKKLFVILFALSILLVGCTKETIPYGVSVKDGVGFFTFEGPLTSRYLPGALEYFSTHGIKRVVMEMHSPGGSFYEMWRIIAWMEAYDNIEYETRTYSLAGSAGLIVFLAGDIRLISHYPTFMWHNVQSYVPEEVKKFYNERNNTYFASRTGLTVEQIQEKIESAGGDWYFGAKEAIALGIAHGYIE